MTYFKNVSTLEELRGQYEELLKKYHPDCAGGSTAATQEINAEYDRLFESLKNRHEDTSGPESKYNFEEDEKLREVINQIISFNGIVIEVVGNWIWLSGNTYQYKADLKMLGFMWAAKKKMWYWRSESYQKKSRKTLSMDAIRDYYGSVRVNTQAAVALEA